MTSCDSFGQLFNLWLRNNLLISFIFSKLFKCLSRFCLVLFFFNILGRKQIAVFHIKFLTGCLSEAPWIEVCEKFVSVLLWININSLLNSPRFLKRFRIINTCPISFVFSTLGQLCCQRFQAYCRSNRFLPFWNTGVSINVNIDVCTFVYIVLIHFEFLSINLI